MYKRIARPLLLRGDRVCLVSHAEPIRALVGYIGGMSEEATLKLDLHSVPYIFRGPF